MTSGVLITDSPTYLALEQKHNSGLPNGGNTTDHHSATKEHIADVTALLNDRKDGRYFYVTTGGVAKVGAFQKSSKHGGASYDPYSHEGDEIIYKEWEFSNGAPGEGRRSRLVATHRGTSFDVREFVPITWLGLVERLKGRVAAQDLSAYDVVVDDSKAEVHS